MIVALGRVMCADISTSSDKHSEILPGATFQATVFSRTTTAARSLAPTAFAETKRRLIKHDAAVLDAANHREMNLLINWCAQ